MTRQRGKLNKLGEVPDSSTVHNDFATRSPKSLVRKIGHRIESQECWDVFGQKLLFHTIQHDSDSLCNEYIIERSPFSIKRWMCLTVLFSASAIQYEVYNRDISILGLTLICLCIGLVTKLHSKVKQESLLVIASIGLQFTTTFATGRQASQFIRHCHIKDVVINEGITLHRVLFYLAILLKDASQPLGIGKVLPLFQHTFPQLDCLQQMYSGIQISLFGNS